MAEPGGGYRLLQVGESILPTDEYWHSGVGPWEVYCKSSIVTIGHVPFRRKIEESIII